ncbi:MAG: hypothetical protein PHE89_02420 [Alphaproteobacteria bacterium]|nr:hypothetical protein [Alphaproteobacteria bacterium]
MKKILFLCLIVLAGCKTVKVGETSNDFLTEDEIISKIITESIPITSSNTSYRIIISESENGKRYVLRSPERLTQINYENEKYVFVEFKFSRVKKYPEEENIDENKILNGYLYQRQTSYEYAPFSISVGQKFFAIFDHHCAANDYYRIELMGEAK